MIYHPRRVYEFTSTYSSLLKRSPSNKPTPLLISTPTHPPPPSLSLCSNISRLVSPAETRRSGGRDFTAQGHCHFPFPSFSLSFLSDLTFTIWGFLCRIFLLKKGIWFVCCPRVLRRLSSNIAQISSKSSFGSTWFSNKGIYSFQLKCERGLAILAFEIWVEGGFVVEFMYFTGCLRKIFCWKISNH